MLIQLQTSTNMQTANSYSQSGELYIHQAIAIIPHLANRAKERKTLPTPNLRRKQVLERFQLIPPNN